MREIITILNSCMSIIGTMRIDYNTPVGPRTKALTTEIKKLIPLIENDEPCIANILKRSLSNIVINYTFINAYVFGDIRTSLYILNDMYASKENDAEITKLNKQRKKIFISHSSKDKIIVEKYVDHILMLGIGLSSDDIFCTSIEDLAIKNGDDIREHIHSNIQNADFSILLLSENYKKSEICLNEMGAVWAYSNNVRFYLLPNFTSNEIGWLCDPSKADKLFDSIALDTLKIELSKFYSIEDKGTTWSRQRKNFLEFGKSYEIE